MSKKLAFFTFLLSVLTFISSACIFSQYFEFDNLTNIGYIVWGLTITFCLIFAVYDIAKLIKIREYDVTFITTGTFSIIFLFVNIIIMVVHVILVLNK